MRDAGSTSYRRWLLFGLGFLFVISGCSYQSTDQDTLSESSTASGLDDDDATDNDTGDGLKPEEWGPYGVGFRMFEWTDPGREDRRVPTIVYYPSNLPTPDHEDYEQIKKGASLLDRVSSPAYVGVQNATAAPGPFPLVVFSHGSGARNIQYKFLLEFLASHGYVVAAPNHVGNVGILHYMPFGIDQTVERLFDIRFVIDGMTAVFADAGDPLYHAGDAENVALAGHSYGGNIALALAGTTYSWDYIEELCVNDPVDRYICPVAEQRAKLEPILPDPRVRVVVSIAHDGTQSYFGPDGVGAAGLAVPTLLIATDGDAFCPYEKEAVPFFDRLAVPSFMLHFFGGSHMGFTDVKNLGETPLGTIHAVTRGAVTAFFAQSLKGDESFSLDIEAGFGRLNPNGQFFEWMEKEGPKGF